MVVYVNVLLLNPEEIVQHQIRENAGDGLFGTLLGAFTDGNKHRAY